MQKIKISQILDDLNRGLTRSPKTGGYNPEIGSIKEKYNLTNKELKYLFDNPKLKGRRAGQVVNITVEDDTEEKEEVVNNSGLTPEHFDNPWQEEVERAREAKEVAKQALSQ